MLDQKLRAAILALHEKGRSRRSIARALKISRDTVKEVIASGSMEVPLLVRPQLADAWREEILAQHDSCGGNLVRVHEELTKKGAKLSYPALTAFCRHNGIGYEAPKPSGRYDFAPGEEMQHDTSQHWPKIGGVKRKAQTASLVLCLSRMLFFQLYLRFTRFECKVFLTEAFEYYPRASFLAAVRQAEQYGLFDLDRLERMVLKEIAHEYFVLPAGRDDEDNGDA